MVSPSRWQISQAHAFDCDRPAGASNTDGPLAVDLLDGASDVDAGTVFGVTNVTGVPGWATLNGTTLGVDPGHPELQDLALGEVRMVTVTYDVTDGAGGSVPREWAKAGGVRVSCRRFLVAGG
jgi:hypothetical protein